MNADRNIEQKMDMRASVTNIFKGQLGTVIIILVALIIFFAFSSQGFFQVKNLYNILQQVAIIGIITIAQAYVIITAGIDLSQGAIIGLTTVVAGMGMVNLGLPIWICIVMGLCVGLGIGIVNGVLVAHLGLPSFIVTLGTMTIFTAVALLLTGGSDVYNLPSEISEFGRSNIGDVIPIIALIMIVLAIVMHIILKKTPFGRYVYAVGSNIQSARFSGVKVRSVLFITYLLAGLICSLAGIVMLCRANAGVALAGQDYQMDSIAAVVIGGGSLFGGEGSIAGAIVGAFLITVLSNGVQMLGLSSYWQQFVTGVVLVVAVLIDTMRRRRSMD